ncbi:hypothetical protein V1512DRAFT_246647 [Lipomyces arxii]|uniref:uncharacterized protein n=1 Tax=Lipomyces arxii TaxID=56418 RepID=UPI0034CF78CF
MAILTPTEILLALEGKLPVITWVHGDAFNTAKGVNSPREDTSHFVDFSLSLGLREAESQPVATVGGFGGDEEDVTAFGKARGATAISSVTEIDDLPVEAPFKRAILRSGLGSTFGPLPLERHQANYDSAVKTYVCGVPKAEQIAALAGLAGD